MIDAGLLRELIGYDPDTGRLTWKSRGAHLFPNGKQPNWHNANIWNGKFAGKPTAITPSSDGYGRVSLMGKRYLAHRVAWAIHYGEWPKLDIDHINMERHDNRLCNLRLANRSNNMMNTKKHQDNTSGYKGVYFEKQTGRYRAGIMRDGKNINLGRYVCAKDAHEAYCRAAEGLHGEFANTGEDKQ